MKKLGLVLVLFCLCFRNSVLAIMISPTYSEIVCKRGDQETLTLTIRNNDPNPIDCYFYATNFEVDVNGIQLFETASNNFSALEMLKIAELKTSIPANEQKEIEIKIFVPRQTKSGEYFAVIMSETKIPTQVKTKEGTTAQIIICKRLGTIIKIVVSGTTIRKEADISKARIKILENQDIEITSILQNKCDLHIYARGKVTIRNESNQVCDRFFLQGANEKVRGKSFIFPQGSRSFSGTIERALPPGKYSAEIEFDYGSLRKAKDNITFEVTQSMGQSQKEFLVLSVDPNLIELEMKTGMFRSEYLTIFNCDLLPLRIRVSSQVFSGADWLQISAEEIIIQANRSKKFRISIFVPNEEPVNRTGKIVLKPEKGKEISVDIIVSEPKEEGDSE